MKLNNNIILLLILVVASVLIFYNYFEIPFTHDEFSALFRTQFSSFSELIEKGVKVDGHPAGIQVFLYYWIKLFGVSEWIIKLPFTLFGIAAIYLSFVIAKNWFNESVGLFSAAFIASTQFTVMYSQIARPYSSGLFFGLMMVYFFTHLIKNPSTKFYLNGIGFILSASLCTYNHHFSMLFAAIVGVSGVFLIDRKYRIKYILGGLLIIVLYVPHLKILIYQLSVGGVEAWLAKPKNDFIIQFLYYCCNFSFFSILTLVSLFCVSIYQSKQYKIDKSTLYLFSTWFLLPFLIGFFYSRYVSSVLQYSVLIFSFPYIVFLIFGNFKNQKSATNLIIVILILCSNCFSLIVERQHYTIFYESFYKEMLLDYKQQSKNSLSIVDFHPKIGKYYSSKLGIDTHFNRLSSLTNELELIHFLESHQQNPSLFLAAGSGIPPNYIPIIFDYYPQLQLEKNYFGGSSYLFCKGKNSNIELDVPKIEKKCIDKATEYSPTYSNSLKTIVKNKNNFIDISLKIKKIEAEKNEIVLVSVLEKKGKEVYWGGTALDKFDTKDKEWITIHHSVKLSDLEFNYKDLQLKVFVWNKGKSSFWIDDFKIVLRKGNPIVYGLNSKL